MRRSLPEITHATVSRAAGGDADAVAEIVRTLERPIYNVALRMLHEREDAEDAAQESLIRIVTRLAQYRGESRFSTWAWRIAVRRILDFREQRAAAARFTFTAFAGDLADGLDLEAAERPQDAVLHRQLKLACGRALLHCLDGDHRIAYVLGEILEMSSSEAGEILDVDPATFRKRLSRARTALTEFMTRHCGIVEATAPCRCHRRLDRAVALGRVDANALDVDEGNLVQLRANISRLSELQRVAAFYRNDPELTSRRDFVATVRAMLGRNPSAEDLA
jgi:RNA polymerase sigma factor (sigma-70 family)